MYCIAGDRIWRQEFLEQINSKEQERLHIQIYCMSSVFFSKVCFLQSEMIKS